MVVQNPSIEGFFYNPSILLDLAAADDVEAFKSAVDSGARLNGSGLWYGTRVGSRKMGYEERTPLMVAALYGSTNVLRYILKAGVGADLNRTAGSDGVSALHLAVSGGAPSSPAAVEILLNCSANPNIVNSNGLKPSDLISPKSPASKKLKFLLGGESSAEDSNPVSPKAAELFAGVSLPDINTGVYSSDEFRMYGFKIKPCSRAYTHDWTECPFAHPGENARRRDPVKNQYSCVPCPEFKKGSCRKADDCEFAHGVFESWLHPAQYRTRLCKDEIGCSRKVCFFAHKKEDLRPVYASTGSALDSGGFSTPPISPSVSPKWTNSTPTTTTTTPQFPGGSRLRSSSSARDVEFFKNHPTNLENMFGLNMNQLRSSYPSRKLSPSELVDGSPKSVAAAMLNSRVAAAAAFAKRSQSFVDHRGAAMGSPVGGGGFYPGWGLGDGRSVDWSVQGDDLSKMRRSASFGIRGNVNVNVNLGRAMMEEPDVSWVTSLVRDVAAPPCSPWIDQVCT